MRSPIPVIGLVCAMGAGEAAAQPLGQVAADEAARRKTIASPARIMREADLRPDYPVTNPTDVPPWPDGAALDPAWDPQPEEPAAARAGRALP